MTSYCLLHILLKISIYSKTVDMKIYFRYTLFHCPQFYFRCTVGTGMSMHLIFSALSMLGVFSVYVCMILLMICVFSLKCGFN